MAQQTKQIEENTRKAEQNTQHLTQMIQELREETKGMITHEIQSMKRTLQDNVNELKATIASGDKCLNDEINKVNKRVDGIARNCEEQLKEQRKELNKEVRTANEASISKVTQMNERLAECMTQTKRFGCETSS